MKRVSRLRRLVEDGQVDMNNLRAEQRTAEAELRGLINTGRELVARRAGEICTRFKEYAASFLAETCELTYQPENRKFGQETAAFPMPRFTVRMTSGVFKEQAQPRTEREDVSKSQKEFVDLAFRMALMLVAAGDEPTMLVLENS